MDGPLPPSPDLRARFLSGMSHAACTVNVVTTDGPAGRIGVTVSAMASVSADTPRPTLLVCIHHLSPAAEKILANGVFCVNVLRDDQSYISDAFAGRFREALGDKFDCAPWTTQVTGAPRVVDPLVAFDCRVMSSERVGTHHVLFGEVEDIFAPGAGSPLIYANRAYGTAARIEPVTSVAAGAVRAGAELRLGCFHTFGPYVAPALLARAEGAPVRLVEGDHRRLVESLRAGETDLALIYDFDLGDGLETEPLAELEPYVLLAESQPLAREPALDLERLAAEPMVLLDAPPSADYFVSLFTDKGLQPSIAWRSGSFEMVRGLVGHGLGFAILATKPAAPMTYDGRSLVARPLAGTHRPSRVVLARRANSEPNAAAIAFARAARRFFMPA